MKKIKKWWANIKRFVREIEAYDRINDGKISDIFLSSMCFLTLIVIGLCFIVFGWLK